MLTAQTNPSGHFPLSMVHGTFDPTKLNNNAGKQGDDQPVSVEFSDALGEILIAGRNLKVRLSNFKYLIRWCLRIVICKRALNAKEMKDEKACSMPSCNLPI